MRSFGFAGVPAACVSALLLTGCSAPPQPAPATAAPDPAKVEAEVKAAIKTQVDAYAARDPAKAISIAAPGLVTMFHGEPNVVGLAANRPVMQAQMSDPAMELKVSDETVDVAASGDLAVYHATYRFTFTNPATKRPATEAGNWIAVFRRQPDGAMKMIRDIVADTPAG
jgi:ketosteroid isomerase-like protein